MGCVRQFGDVQDDEQDQTAMCQQRIIGEDEQMLTEVVARMNPRPLPCGSMSCVEAKRLYTQVRQ